VLVCKFGLDRHHSAIAAAAAFLSNFQTGAGDHRGIYGHQYSDLWVRLATCRMLNAISA